MPDEKPNREIPILWQSTTTLVVDKPWDLPTQAAPGIESLQSCLRIQLARRDEYLEMPHRLDRGVGGVVIVALTRKSARLLSQQFESRKTVKRYIAAVHGVIDPAHENRAWKDYLRKIPDEARVEICDESDSGARLAETCIESIQSRDSRSHIIMRPITGRMHQLRIQCASRGHPIIGDSMYANQGNASSKGRIMLHAVSIRFHDPATGKLITVKSSDQAFLKP